MIRATLRWLGRVLTDLGQPPAPDVITNRAQLLREPTPDDHCDSFEAGTPAGDCQSDGHYLCVGCSCLDPDVAYYREHGDWHPEDEDEIKRVHDLIKEETP